jgi:hypothetical protein
MMGWRFQSTWSYKRLGINKRGIIKEVKLRFGDYYFYCYQTEISKLAVLNTQELIAPLLFLLYVLSGVHFTLKTTNFSFFMSLNYLY